MTTSKVTWFFKHLKFSVSSLNEIAGSSVLLIDFQSKMESPNC